MNSAKGKDFVLKSIGLIALVYSFVFADSAFAEEDKTTADEAAKEKIDLVEEPVIKRLDVSKIGAEAAYKTFEGQRLGGYFPAKYFLIAQRVEIYQEPKPIDAYIMDARKIRWLHNNQPWDTPVDFRAQIQPIFTRSYGTEITMNDPKVPNTFIRYIHDYRDIYQNQFPIYQLNPQSDGTDIPYTINTNYKHEQWDQNEVLYMYTTKIPHLDWSLALNVGYRYSIMTAKNDGSTFSYRNVRHTYYSYAILAPNDKLEMMGQFEYFKDKRVSATFDYRPDHYLYALEARVKSNDYKNIYIPRISYSKDKYWPLYNRYQKMELQYKVGRDWAKKFKSDTVLKYQLDIRNEVDNTAPTYGAPNPVNDTAAWAGVENRAQYNIYDRLWIQGGLDYSAGLNMSNFDNWALLAGLEYYAPGLIRVDVGWRGNQYYNIDDYLSTVYFKVYLFM